MLETPKSKLVAVGEAPRRTSKVAVLTGATGGIGQAVATAYDALGYHLILVGRSEEKLEQLQASLGNRHETITADLSLVSENVRVGQEIGTSQERVDLLLNLVGIIAETRQVTPEGNELSLATNLLGPVALTQTLGAERAVVTGSEAIMFAKDLEGRNIQYEDGYKGFRAYAQAKAYLTLWAFTAGAEYSVSVADPGATKTEMARSSAVPFMFRLLHPLISHDNDVAANAFVKSGHDLTTDLTERQIILPKTSRTPKARFYNKAMGDRLVKTLQPLLQTSVQ